MLRLYPPIFFCFLAKSLAFVLGFIAWHSGLLSVLFSEILIRCRSLNHTQQGQGIRHKVRCFHHRSRITMATTDFWVCLGTWAELMVEVNQLFLRRNAGGGVLPSLGCCVFTPSVRELPFTLKIPDTQNLLCPRTPEVSFHGVSEPKRPTPWGLCSALGSSCCSGLSFGG